MTTQWGRRKLVGGLTPPAFEKSDLGDLYTAVAGGSDGDEGLLVNKSDRVRILLLKNFGGEVRLVEDRGDENPPDLPDGSGTEDELAPWVHWNRATPHQWAHVDGASSGTSHTIKNGNLPDGTYQVTVFDSSSKGEVLTSFEATVSGTSLSSPTSETLGDNDVVLAENVSEFDVDVWRPGRYFSTSDEPIGIITADGLRFQDTIAGRCLKLWSPFTYSGHELRLNHVIHTPPTDALGTSEWSVIGLCSETAEKVVGGGFITSPRCYVREIGYDGAGAGGAAGTISSTGDNSNILEIVQNTDPGDVGTATEMLLRSYFLSNVPLTTTQLSAGYRAAMDTTIDGVGWYGSNSGHECVIARSAFYIGLLGT